MGSVDNTSKCTLCSDTQFTRQYRRCSETCTVLCSADTKMSLLTRVVLNYLMFIYTLPPKKGHCSKTQATRLTSVVYEISKAMTYITPHVLYHTPCSDTELYCIISLIDGADCIVYNGLLQLTALGCNFSQPMFWQCTTRFPWLIACIGSVLVDI